MKDVCLMLLTYIWDRADGSNTFLKRFGLGWNMEKISIIVPVYNEEGTISELLDEVMQANVDGVQKEVIVVNDGSTDWTKDKLDRYAKKQRSIRVYHHSTNRGKGAAIKTGIARATGDILLIQDADLEYHPKEYPKILRPLLKKEAKVVYGSRIEAIKRNLEKMYLLHYIGNRMLSLTTSVLYGQWITDMETGYKAFRREVLVGMLLNSRRFDIEPEITAKILKRGYRIVEVPIDFFGRSFKEGKKITWKDGLVALWVLLKYRFVD